MAKTHVDISTFQFFEQFQKDFPNYPINSIEYKKIVEKIGFVMSKLLLDDGCLKLPNRLGLIKITKFKPVDRKFQPLYLSDPKKSKDAGEKVLNFNDHTDGYMYHFIWDKESCKNLCHKNMWVWKPIRSLKRTLAQVLKAKEKDYPESKKVITTHV